MKIRTKKLEKKEVSRGGKIFGFMHVATMNNWKDIVNELLDFARKSGLLCETELLTLVILGRNSRKLAVPFSLRLPNREDLRLIRYPVNSKIISGGNNLRRYEGPTIKELWKKCNDTDEEFYVYYVHTKGASYGSNFKSDKWRRAMASVILGAGWRECVDMLKSGKETCGIMRRKNHYAGNFWWARASYIRTLERPKTTRNRFYYENWLNLQD